jgi:hypothetical protein
MRRLFRYFLLLVLIVVLGIAGFIGYFVWEVHHGISQLNAVPLSPANYQPAAIALIQLCQTDPGIYEEAVADMGDFNPVWAPSSVTKLDPEGVDIAADHATVTWGGGFYHCGWELVRGARTAEGSGFSWTLSFFSEDSPNQVLQTITVSSNQRLTEDQFVNQVLSELDRRLVAQADDGLFTSEATWYPAAARCIFLMKKNRVDMLPAPVRKAAATYPHDWRDVLLCYLLDRAANDPSADQKLRQWADQTNCPAAWMYASYAFYQGGNFKAGDEAIKNAVASKSPDPAWLDKDVPLYELGMTVRLYQSGNFTGCVSLCDGILTSHHSYFSTASSVHNVRDWAAATAASRPLKLPDFDEFTSLDPFGGFDLNLLMAVAKLPHPTTMQ